MLKESFRGVFDKVRYFFFNKVFKQTHEYDDSLTAMEAFSLEIIEFLHEPTIGQFADFLKISQSNATYRVNNLIRKGYLIRQNSEKDRREYHLILSEKFYIFASMLTSYESVVLQRMEERFTEEELAIFDRMLRVISEELMPECDEADRS